MSSLPTSCFVKNDATGCTVIVKRGEKGYTELSDAYAHVDPDLLNAHAGVTKAEAAAMKVGSMFGWHVPGANPSRYDDEGRPV